MDILIKGMEMPQACLKGGCPLDGASCPLWERKHWDSEIGHYVERHKNCPLVAVPDHGDLIDRDTLLRKVQKWYWEALETVKNMPVVIPAERSEDA